MHISAFLHLSGAGQLFKMWWWRFGSAFWALLGRTSACLPTAGTHHHLHFPFCSSYHNLGQNALKTLLVFVIIIDLSGRVSPFYGWGT